MGQASSSEDTAESLARDIGAIARIAAVPSMLKMI
jgi:hypothetical protein